ncbi:hypothetical protein [Dietzia sp. ANT_WB102]|uniref:hypothetical protein n=1 Tax=Dietzia sp. ANT_WB102 TaxID=2597345 RepID=UPI0011EBAA5C|nr:hypothetical protein [Dietzia sp. ANT_WB102]KAA0917000.1 hypothetical protein FQ137_12210 [Dietzia sp. ANT_WB102]
MANVTREVASCAGRLSRARNHHPDADHSGLERDLITARIAHQAEKLASEAPPLTDAQIQKIVSVIRTAGLQGGGQA